MEINKCIRKHKYQIHLFHQQNNLYIGLEIFVMPGNYSVCVWMCVCVRAYGCDINGIFTIVNWVCVDEWNVIAYDIQFDERFNNMSIKLFN